MFIRLTADVGHDLYVNVCSIKHFSKPGCARRTWLTLQGEQKEEMVVRESPEQIMELINEHQKA